MATYTIQMSRSVGFVMSLTQKYDVITPEGDCSLTGQHEILINDIEAREGRAHL